MFVGILYDGRVNDAQLQALGTCCSVKITVKVFQSRIVFSGKIYLRYCCVAMEMMNVIDEWGRPTLTKSELFKC